MTICMPHYFAMIRTARVLSKSMNIIDNRVRKASTNIVHRGAKVRYNREEWLLVYTMFSEFEFLLNYFLTCHKFRHRTIEISKKKLIYTADLKIYNIFLHFTLKFIWKFRRDKRNSGLFPECKRNNFLKWKTRIYHFCNFQNMTRGFI